MNGGPDWELQRAVVAALSADARMQTLIGNPIRLYQFVPKDFVLPYMTIGESQDIADAAECIDGSEIFVTLHVFSEGKSFVQAKTIGAAVHGVLKDADLALIDFRCVEIAADVKRFFTDPDGITIHGVLSYRALVEPAD